MGTGWQWDTYTHSAMLNPELSEPRLQAFMYICVSVGEAVDACLWLYPAQLLTPQLWLPLLHSLLPQGQERPQQGQACSLCSNSAYFCLLYFSGSTLKFKNVFVKKDLYGHRDGQRGYQPPWSPAGPLSRMVGLCLWQSHPHIHVMPGSHCICSCFLPF